MVLSGADASTQAGPDEVAEATVRVLRDQVPADVAGVVFLSGGQSDVNSTIHLNEMNRSGPHPWPLSFSYGRALQAPSLAAWGGDRVQRRGRSASARAPGADERAGANGGLLGGRGVLGRLDGSASPSLDVRPRTTRMSPLIVPTCSSRSAPPPVAAASDMSSSLTGVSGRRAEVQVDPRPARDADLDVAGDGCTVVEPDATDPISTSPETVVELHRARDRPQRTSPEAVLPETAPPTSRARASPDAEMNENRAADRAARPRRRSPSSRRPRRRRRRTGRHRSRCGSPAIRPVR